MLTEIRIISDSNFNKSVILDLKFDPATGKIYADKSCYYDQQGKSGIADDPQGLTSYLCNIHQTLLTRGIRGTYVYVCNDELRDYLAKYMEGRK